MVSVQVLVLTFDAVLTIYAFSAIEPNTAASGVGGQRASPVCEQRFGRWHTSTTAMSFHAGEQGPFLVCYCSGDQLAICVFYCVCVFAAFELGLIHTAGKRGPK